MSMRRQRIVVICLAIDVDTFVTVHLLFLSSPCVVSTACRHSIGVRGSYTACISLFVSKFVQKVYVTERYLAGNIMLPSGAGTI